MSIEVLFNDSFYLINSSTSFQQKPNVYLFVTRIKDNGLKSFKYRAQTNADYEKAIDNLNKIISISPNFKYAYLLKGIALARLYMADEAISEFGRFIEIDTNYAFAYLMRGHAKSNMLDESGNPFPDYYEAALDYERAVNIDSHILDRECLQAYIQTGEFYFFNGEYKKALYYFNTAVKINPQYAYGYIGRGMTKQELKDYMGAIGDYTEAINIDNQNTTAYEFRGNVKSILTEYESAILDYDNVIKIDENYPNAYKNRSLAREKMGDVIGAETDKKLYLKLGGV